MLAIATTRILRPLQLSTKGLNRSAKFFQSTHAQLASKRQSGLKGLMQEYGYSALGVYLAVGMIDLPLCYLLVSYMGEEKIGEYEQAVKKFFGFGKKQQDEPDFKPENDSSPVKGSIWTTFAISYGLHKSLIFIRLPIAAAITPSVVSKLRSMGFNIGNSQFRTIASSAKESYKEHGLRKSVSTKGVKEIMNNSKQIPGLPGSAPGSAPVSTNPAPTSAPNSAPAPSKHPNFGTPPTKRQKWWSWFF